MRLATRLYLWATSLLYNQFAWSYDGVAWLVSLGRWGSWRRMVFDHLAGTRILDIGFGTGDLLVEMRGRGLDAFGLEESPAMHRVTARKLRKVDLYLPRVRARAQRMPFASASFDSAVATFPAGYILERATLAEVTRVIRPPSTLTGFAGGRFVVVGLLTGQRNWLVRRAASYILSATDERILSYYMGATSEVGLDLEVIVQGERRWQVPVAVSRKCAPEADSPA
jgi:ubiquinone/menaquinone biosynthesis C-methylase UbiE